MKNPSWLSLFLSTCISFYLTWPCTCWWCTKHDKSVGYFLFTWSKKKKKNLTQWNHILIVVDRREFPSCWTWVASIPKCFSSRIPALKDVKIFFFHCCHIVYLQKSNSCTCCQYEPVIPQCSRCVLDVMFIVLGFHSLVDYLTSFSGVDLSSLMFSEDVPLPLPSWQVDVQIVLYLVDMFAQIELLLLSRNSYFYIHFCTLRVVTCIFFFSITCNIS